MTKTISQDDVQQTLDQLMHPEINYSLVKMGMIKDVAIKDNKVRLILKVPFMAIPIKDDLVHSIKKVVTKLETGLEVEINLVVMTQEERAAFVALAREGWKF